MQYHKFKLEQNKSEVYGSYRIYKNEKLIAYSIGYERLKRYISFFDIESSIDFKIIKRKRRSFFIIFEEDIVGIIKYRYNYSRVVYINKGEILFYLKKAFLLDSYDVLYKNKIIGKVSSENFVTESIGIAINDEFDYRHLLMVINGIVYGMRENPFRFLKSN